MLKVQRHTHSHTHTCEKKGKKKKQAVMQKIYCDKYTYGENRLEKKRRTLKRKNADCSVGSPCVPHPPAGPCSELRWCQRERERAHMFLLLQQQYGGKEKREGDKKKGGRGERERELSETGGHDWTAGRILFLIGHALLSKPRLCLSLLWMW